MATAVRSEVVEELAVSVLTFLVSDTSTLSRFLDVTGWTPETLAEPDSRQTILVAAMDYLMREEDLLLTFAANSGVDPQEVSRAFRALTESETGGPAQND